MQGSHVVPANHYCVICRRLYSSFNLVICIASCAGREITCVFCNLLLKRCQIAMSKIFFEKQEGMLCAQHALNNLLQGAYFSAVDLAEIARKLDELERSVLGTVDGDLSLNVNDDGYFSVQVISEALKVFDLRLVGLCDFQARNVGSLMCSAFICNFENHWFTLRRIGGRWFNLNSLNSGPTIISDSHLELFLAQLTAEGYTVFVVEGELPPCPAENDVIDCSDIEEIVKVDSDPFQPKSLPALSPTDYADDSDEDFLKALIASREAADHNDRSLQKALMESKANDSYASPLSIVLPDCLRLNDSTCRAVMWFEARRQERKIRTIMVDHKKRAERRRFYYERIRKDPTEFMQLHGQACKIHFDCQSADSSSILRPWQGDPTVLIDRFDARSYLDKLPDSGKDSDRSKSSSFEERKINYERYRLLVINDFEKIPEEKFLRQIYMEERFGSSTQVQSKRDESKKKKHRPTAAIGYTYEDSTDSVNSYQQFVKTSGVSGKEGQQHWNAKAEENNLSSDEEEEDEFGTVFILLFIHQNSHFKDVRLDISQLTSEDMHELNRIATRYGMKMGDFTKFLAVDEQERDHLQSLKEMEEQRATLSGKHSRRERKRLKDICRSSRADFGLPLEMLRKVEPPSQQLEKPSESSTSESDDANENAVTYITSFDGDMKAEVKKKPKSKRHSSSARRRDTHSPIRRNCRRRSPSYSACDSRSSRKRLRRYSSASSLPSPDRRRQYSRAKYPLEHERLGAGTTRGGKYEETSEANKERANVCSSYLCAQQWPLYRLPFESMLVSQLSSSSQPTLPPDDYTLSTVGNLLCLGNEKCPQAALSSHKIEPMASSAHKCLHSYQSAVGGGDFEIADAASSQESCGPRYRGKQDEARGAAARKNCTPRKFADVGSARFYCWSVCPLYDVILQEREEEFRELTFRRRQELDRRNRGMQDPELTQESFRSKVSRSNRSSYRRRENRSSSDTSR
ncbi:Josephin [Trichuris suis]|nr:Josephin [Trichuris suis]